VTSKLTTLVDLRVGYKFSDQARLWLDILNLFDNTGAHQIDYFYPSQLANETAPVYDVHFKPVEPLSVRLTLSDILNAELSSSLLCGRSSLSCRHWNLPEPENAE
jgi:hypothetical protein